MRAWLGKLWRMGFGLVLGLGIIGVFVLILVTQTPFGRERLLAEVLARVGGGIRGSLAVGSMSSPGLLRGFTFRNVVIRGEDGRPFLEADSVRAGISAPALLRGDLVFMGVRLWRPRVTIERLAGQTQLNAVAIFAGSPTPDTLGQPRDTLRGDSLALTPSTIAGDSLGGADEGGGARRTILLRGVRLMDGSLDILLPLGGGVDGRDRILTAPAPDGRTLLRRMSFRDLELELDQTVLRAPGQRGERFEVDNLSFLGEVWPDPVRVSGLRGELRREGGRLLGALERVELPGSKALGRLDIRWGGPAGARVMFQGNADPLDLGDIAFLDPRLPSGSARGDFGFELGDEGVLLNFQDTELTSDLGRIEARGGLFLASELGFRDLALRMESVDLGITDGWVEDTVPLRGRMDGDLTLSGTLDSLELEARVELTDPDSTGKLAADVTGRLGITDGFSASSLHLTLAPLEWGALSSISTAMRLRGSGAVRLILNGDLTGDGLGIDGELTHVPYPAERRRTSDQGSEGRALLTPPGGASRVVVAGRIRRDSTDLFLDLTGTLSPLSLTSIQTSYPSFPLQGEYSGRVEVQGPVSDLQIAADLETSGGPVALRARFDTRHPSEAYSVEAESQGDFVLSNLLPSLPAPTRMTGSLAATGRGFSLDSLQGDLSLTVRQGTLAHLEVDTAAVVARVESGVLLLSELMVETGAGRVTGTGSLGVAAASRRGEITLQVQADSLGALRPFIMEEPALILDDLTPRVQEMLVAEGVELDTIPTAASVAVAGSAGGELLLRGGFSGFSVDGTLSFRGLRLRTDYVESGSTTFTVEGLPGPDARIRGTVRVDSMQMKTLAFRGGSAEVEFARSRGSVRAIATRSAREHYDAQATFALDSLGGGIVNLDQLTLQFDSIRWGLGGPASLSWSPEGYRVRDFQLIRPGVGAMRLRVDGFLPALPGVEGDLLLEAESVNLARLAGVIQMDTPLEGFVDVRGRMTGTTEAPALTGVGSGRDLRYGDFSLDTLTWNMASEGQQILFELQGGEGGHEVISAGGSFPVDLRLRPEGGRFPEGPLDVRLAVDSFPAAVALAFLDSVEDVEGALTGTLHFGGTSRDLEPSGTLTLSRGSASLPDLGVRYQEVESLFALSPDGIVEVDGVLSSVGTAHVTGTVDLSNPISNPRLNLHVEAQSLLAVNRRDTRARLSGYLDVTNRYRQPRVTGALTVEEGVLMVDEVARSVEVVDLSDPAFFDVVDTTFVTLRPILLSNLNPFLQNLRLDVDLTMAQDSWLRGRELNVEMTGTLGVYWDRTERDMAFLGVLDAVRGVYSVFGRQFQVQSGTVSFPGTPGINPDLNITAVNRVRDASGTWLDIIANVEGSLLVPTVTLSSNSPVPLAESDLVSYLIFGQSSSGLTSGQAQMANRASVVFGGATASLALGLFSSELGSVLAQDVGLDYLSITQGGAFGRETPTIERRFANTWATTQVEVGQYLTDNIFAALLWRPPTQSGGNKSPIASLRLETRLSDRWTLELYSEDRFLRSGLYGIGYGDLGNEEVRGFFLFRQWGY